MHRGMRGKWDFIDMINGGVACLADEVQSQILQRRGLPPVRLHVYSIAINANKVINIKTMHKHMIEGWNLMYMLWCVKQFNLNVVFAITFANSKSTYEFKFNHVAKVMFDQVKPYWKCVWYASEVWLKCGMLMWFKLQNHLKRIQINSI